MRLTILLHNYNKSRIDVSLCISTTLAMGVYAVRDGGRGTCGVFLCTVSVLKRTRARAQQQ